MKALCSKNEKKMSLHLLMLLDCSNRSMTYIVSYNN